jgi:hypothetical protein
MPDTYNAEQCDMFDAMALDFFKRLSEDEAIGDAFTSAVDLGLRSYCQCGDPLTLGMIHHKHARCEPPK